MAARTISGSGFDPKFGLLAPSFPLSTGFVAVYRQVLSDFTLGAVITPDIGSVTVRDAILTILYLQN